MMSAANTEQSMEWDDVASSQESVSTKNAGKPFEELKKTPVRCRKDTKIRPKATEKISQTKGMSNF